MDHSEWEQVVGKALKRFISCSLARRIVRRVNTTAEPEEYLGDLYLRVVRCKRFQRELPASSETVIVKRVWSVAHFHLRNALRQEFAVRTDEIPRNLTSDCPEVNLEELVGQLPEPLRTVVRHRLESKSFTQIAAINGVAVGTVSRQFRKAIQLLKAAASDN